MEVSVATWCNVITVMQATLDQCTVDIQGSQSGQPVPIYEGHTSRSMWSPQTQMYEGHTWSSQWSPLLGRQGHSGHGGQVVLWSAACGVDEGIKTRPQVAFVLGNFFLGNGLPSRHCSACPNVMMESCGFHVQFFSRSTATPTRLRSRVREGVLQWDRGSHRTADR